MHLTPAYHVMPDCSFVFLTKVSNELPYLPPTINHCQSQLITAQAVVERSLLSVIWKPTTYHRSPQLDRRNSCVRSYRRPAQSVSTIWCVALFPKIARLVVVSKFGLKANQSTALGLGKCSHKRDASGMFARVVAAFVGMSSRMLAKRSKNRNRIVRQIITRTAQHAHPADRFAREILAILEHDTRACGG